MRHQRERGQLRLPTLVDLETVARHLGVEVRHVRRLVAEDRIPYVKWGRLLRFDLDEIAAWIDANRHTPHLPRWPIRLDRHILWGDTICSLD